MTNKITIPPLHCDFMFLYSYYRCQLTIQKFILCYYFLSFIYSQYISMNMVSFVLRKSPKIAVVMYKITSINTYLIAAMQWHNNNPHI